MLSWPALIELTKVSALVKKYKKAVKELPSAQAAFQELNSSASEDQRARWTQMAEDADRSRMTDISNMDVYDATEETGRRWPNYLLCVVTKIL